MTQSSELTSTGTAWVETLPLNSEQMLRLSLLVAWFHNNPEHERLVVNYSGAGDSGNELEWDIELPGSLHGVIDELCWEIIEFIGADFNNEGSQGAIIFTPTSVRVEHEDNLEDASEYLPEFFVEPTDITHHALEPVGKVVYDKEAQEEAIAEYAKTGIRPSLEYVDSVFDWESEWNGQITDKEKQEGWVFMYDVPNDDRAVNSRLYTFGVEP